MNQYNNKFGLSSVVPEMKISDPSIVAIDYSGQGLFDEVKDGFNDYKELYEVESFSLNIAVTMSDINIICIECLSLSDKEGYFWNYKPYEFSQIDHITSTKTIKPLERPLIKCHSLFI
jgi:hypothetical protein